MLGIVVVGVDVVMTVLATQLLAMSAGVCECVCGCVSVLLWQAAPNCPMCSMGVGGCGVVCVLCN